MNENEIGTIVVESAIELHRELGPGLLETVYESLLANMLQEKGLQIQRQASIPIVFRGTRIEEGFRADINIENKVILELKSVETVAPVHRKQVQTYLRLTGCRLGYLLNFGEALMKDGITRCVYRLPE